MRYISPATLFGSTLPNPLDKKAIQLQRKKLLAELELSGNTTIDIKGTKWSINDIIQYFEELQDETILSFHNAIAQDKALRTFLEEGRFADTAANTAANAATAASPASAPANAATATATAPGHTPANTFTVIPTPLLVTFISPFYTAAFTDYLLNAFARTDEKALLTLRAHPLLMTGPDQAKAWGAIVKKLDQSLQTIQQYHQATKRLSWNKDLKKIVFLLEPPYTRMVGLLPNAYTGNLKDRYAFVMMQASIQVFNKNTRNRKQALSWIQNALDIAVSQQNIHQLQEKYQEMTRIETQRSKIRKRQYIGMAIGGVVFLFALFGGGPNGSNPYSNNLMKMDSALLDSLRRSHVTRDSTLHRDPGTLHY